jgi:hypothetical protein
MSTPITIYPSPISLLPSSPGHVKLSDREVRKRRYNHHKSAGSRAEVEWVVVDTLSMKLMGVPAMSRIKEKLLITEYRLVE